jgi:CheY-like chemotaxis protein
MTAPGGGTPYPDPIPGARAVLAVMSDLLVRSKVDEVARRLGLPLRVARSVEQLERHLAREAPAIAIVDLEADAIDTAHAIRLIAASAARAPIPVVAFASHTNVAVIEAGRAAGANVVLARSGFTMQLPAILTRVAEEERTAGGAEPAPGTGS